MLPFLIINVFTKHAKQARFLNYFHYQQITISILQYGKITNLITMHVKSIKLLISLVIFVQCMRIHTYYTFVVTNNIQLQVSTHTHILTSCKKYIQVHEVCV